MPKNKTLLQKAMEAEAVYRTNRTAPSQEEIELFKAFFSGRISTSQLCAALGARTGNAPSLISSFVRRAFDHNLLVFKE